MQTFIDIRNDPYDWVNKWKGDNKDKKVVAIGVYHFPEEIVHAAGILPFGLQEGSETIVDGYNYIYPAYCGYTRSLIDMGPRGTLRVFDAVLISDICIQLVKADQTLFRNFPSLHPVLIQPSLDLTKDRNKPDLIEEYKRLKEIVEDIAGHKIDDAALKNSFKVYNKNRALLRKIHKMRSKNPSLIRARDMQAVVMSAMVMPKEENNNMLEEFIAELENKKTAARKGIPVFLSGHLCHAPKIEILDMIEEMGGIVVDDDLHTGYRYYAKDVSLDGDPIEALADRFRIIDPPCPSRIHPDNNWDQFLLKKAKEAGVKGVIILQPKFCEHQNFAYIYQKRTLAEGGMDHILIESEHEMISLEKIRTQMQAFVEMIQAKMAKGSKSKGRK